MLRRHLLLVALVGTLLVTGSAAIGLAQDTTQQEPTTATPQESTDQQSSGKAPLQKQDRNAIPGQYIVVLEDGASAARQVANEHAQRHSFTPSHVYQNALKGYAAPLSEAQLERVRSEPQVKFVSRDHAVEASQNEETTPEQPKDPKQETTTPTTNQDSSREPSSEKEATSEGTEPLTSGDSAPRGVRRIGAATTDGTTTNVHQASTANVAVLDTGIQLNHPDLSAVNGKNCINSRKAANDDNGHGTHVAGTIGAKNNAAGVVGVAPGTKLSAVKVLNSRGSGSWSQVICGIDWVTSTLTDTDTSNDVKVANMSLSGWLEDQLDDENCGNTNSDALHQAICGSTTAGVTYAVAAGNDEWAIEDDYWTAVPAAYNEVLTVTAMADYNGRPGGGAQVLPSGCTNYGDDDSYASFSNFALSTQDQSHTVGGPGVCIRSTWLKSGYRTASGTSMATPHLAGSIALCLGNGQTSGACASTNPTQIMQRIISDARTQDENDFAYGFIGDPTSSPVNGSYYGYLGWAGGY